MSNIELSSTYNFVKDVPTYNIWANLSNELFFMIFMIFLLVSLIIIFKWLFPNDEHMSVKFVDHINKNIDHVNKNIDHVNKNIDQLSTSDTHLTINIEKYIPDYWGYPYGGNLWHDQYTPFTWNNATKFPSWYYPPYTYIENYYRDYYRYPYY